MTMVKAQTKRIVYLAALAGLAATLTGCDSFRSAAGLDKQSPDEFAVVSKAPLIMPPDYNLKPPKPGMAPTNQVSPTDAAEDTLYGQTAPATSSQGQLSAGEQALLTQAGASNANDLIRQRIAADNRAMLASDASFTNKLLFETGGDASVGTPVDADAERKRLNGGGEGAAPAQPAQPAQEDSQSDGGMVQDTIGKWLGDIF